MPRWLAVGNTSAIDELPIEVAERFCVWQGPGRKRLRKFSLVVEKAQVPGSGAHWSRKRPISASDNRRICEGDAILATFGSPLGYRVNKASYGLMNSDVRYAFYGLTGGIHREHGEAMSSHSDGQRRVNCGGRD